MSIRKVYDSLHGISDDTVSLSSAVEIIAYCLIDGKLEQGSGFETDLYNDLVVQLKSMKDGFQAYQSLRFPLRRFQNSNVVLKPEKHLPKRTLALIWIYLQIIGPAADRLLSEEDLWTIDRTDFEKASLFLLLKNPAYQDPTALEMRELISVHFNSENQFTEWVNYANEKVLQGPNTSLIVVVQIEQPSVFRPSILDLTYQLKLIFVFKFAKEFPEECIYVAIKAEESVKDGLSGKYYFHSLHKNVGTYVREPKRVPGYTSKQFFLVYQNGVWYIQTDDSVNVCFLWGGAGGLLRLASKGWLLKRNFTATFKTDSAKKRTWKQFFFQNQY